MGHICKLKDEEVPETARQRCKRILLSLILVSASNPLHLNYFKSDLSIRREQERHLKISKHIVHPFSQFRGMYEVYLVVMYILAVIFTPMTTFFKMNEDETIFLVDVYRYTIILVFLCWVDIIMTFFTGYIKRGRDMDIIELRSSKIAKHYITGPYFICDVLSSIPKAILFKYNFLYVGNYPTYIFSGILDILAFIKIVRLVPLFGYIYKSAKYLNLKSNSVPFFFSLFLTAMMVVHWAACLQYGVSKWAAYFEGESYMQDAWIYQANMQQKTVFEKYIHCFFKSSAYVLAIRQPLYEMKVREDYCVAVFTYFIGKILVASVWLILAMAILNARSVDVKFLELKNQLKEYMWRKRLPLNLRDRISRYYDFKFQKKYFKETQINAALSGNIKSRVIMHICKTMIKEVAIFSDLSYGEISVIVDCLTSEIFLPNDIIFQHGTVGDAMYFLFSGTVAVYTRSGKEICHLQEGTYFGEVSLLLPDQVRVATVVSIETCQVYVLKKKDFGKHLMKNANVMLQMFQTAESRMKEAKQYEEDYNRMMFERDH